MDRRGTDPAVVAAVVPADRNQVVPTGVEGTHVLGVDRGTQLQAVVAGSLVVVGNGEGTVVVVLVGDRGTVVVAQVDGSVWVGSEVGREIRRLVAQVLVAYHGVRYLPHSAAGWDQRQALVG